MQTRNLDEPMDLHMLIWRLAFLLTYLAISSHVFFRTVQVEHVELVYPYSDGMIGY